MRRSLPKFEQIEAFIAAADATSFRSAAAQCAISPAAFSRRIRAFTDHVGLPLFVRTASGARLTEAGRRCRAELEPAYLALRGTAGRLGVETGFVTVSLSHTLAVGWLFPKLQAFLALDTGIDLRIKVDRTPASLRAGDVDLAICFSDSDLGGLSASPLLEVAVLPVASPSLADRLRGRLDGAPLLAASVPQDGWRWWTRTSGVQFAPGQLMRLDLLQEAYEAAAQGLGVALAALPTVTPHLEAGRLASLGYAPLLYPGEYRLVARPGRPARTAVAVVRAFLNDQAAQTGCPA